MEILVVELHTMFATCSDFFTNKNYNCNLILIYISHINIQAGLGRVYSGYTYINFYYLLKF